MRALWSAGRSGERRERRLVALIGSAELRGQAAFVCVCVCVCVIRAGLQQDFSAALTWSWFDELSKKETRLYIDHSNKRATKSANLWLRSRSGLLLFLFFITPAWQPRTTQGESSEHRFCRRCWTHERYWAVRSVRTVGGSQAQVGGEEKQPRGVFFYIFFFRDTVPHVSFRTKDRSRQPLAGKHAPSEQHLESARLCVALRPEDIYTQSFNQVWNDHLVTLISAYLLSGFCLLWYDYQLNCSWMHHYD